MLSSLVGWNELCESTVRSFNNKESVTSDNLISRVDIHLSLLVRWFQSHTAAIQQFGANSLSTLPVTQLLQSILQLNHDTVLTKSQLIRLCQILMVRMKHELTLALDSIDEC